MTKLQIVPKVREVLKSSQRHFKNSKLSYDSEIMFAAQLLEQNDALQKCSPGSIMKAISNVAHMNISLNPALGLAHLVPRKGSCILDIDYKGLINIAITSGGVKGINAEVHYQNDFFDIGLGTDRYIKHKPWYSIGAAEPGPIIGVYAVATLLSGHPEFVYLPKSEVDGIKKNYSKTDVVWKKSYSEMAKKTAIKRLWKLLPKTDDSLELAQAILHDNENNVDLNKEVRRSKESFELPDFEEPKVEEVQIINE